MHHRKQAWAHTCACVCWAPPQPRLPQLGKEGKKGGWGGAGSQASGKGGGSRGHGGGAHTRVLPARPCWGGYGTLETQRSS